MDRTYYLGRNKLEYLTYEDAEKYGEGCVGQRVQKADQYTYYDAPVQSGKGIESAEEVSVPTSIGIDAGNLDAATDEQLKLFLKERKVPGWAFMKNRATLLEKARAQF